MADAPTAGAARYASVAEVRADVERAGGDASEESGRERLITPAFLPRNTGIATIAADGNTEQLSRCCCACFALCAEMRLRVSEQTARIPNSGHRAGGL